MWPFQPSTHQTIHVRFFDIATQRPFADSDIPLTQLPASFEARTTMQLKDESWEVVEARPPHAQDFGRTGRLDLILQKVVVEKLDPKEILYSLPTISDTWPALAADSSKLGKQTVEILEDDWRQVEWISASARDAIEQEFAAIRRIWAEERVGIGFKNIHARTTLKSGVISGATLADLRSSLGSTASWVEGASVQGSAGLIERSFAIRLLSSIEIYGTIKDGAIEFCAFGGTRGTNALSLDLPGLVDFASRHRLLLVDWVRILAVEPVMQDYAAYFQAPPKSVPPEESE